MSGNWNISKDMFLSASEVQKLYLALADAKDLALHRRRFYVHIRDYFILHTFLETGLRVFELTALKVGDFKGDSLIVQNGKGGKKRNIHLMKSTQKLLHEYMKLKRQFLNDTIGENDFLFQSERKTGYSTMGIRKRVKFWFAKCGFSPKLSCHSCRYSYVSHMLENGVPLTLVRDNAGHADLSTTSIYAHTVTNDLGDLNIYESISFGNKGKQNYCDDSRTKKEVKTG